MIRDDAKGVAHGGNDFLKLTPEMKTLKV
jgi:hypothetical protein